jgi:hypothetical protein
LDIGPDTPRESGPYPCGRQAGKYPGVSTEEKKMGWESERWSVSITLDAHGGDKEKEHEKLWRELQIQLTEVARDPKFAGIVWNPPDAIEYESCDIEEDDTGYDVPCLLPRGHDGPHEGVLRWGE